MNIQKPQPSPIPSNRAIALKEGLAPTNQFSTTNNETIAVTVPKKKVKKSKKRRCNHTTCKKKLSLTALTCRCGKKFCRLHFHSEKHNCTYDYKSCAKQALDDNSSVGGGNFEKIQKI